MQQWLCREQFGGVAQLGERTVRIRKVESSILFVSTNTQKGHFSGVPFVFKKVMDKGESLFKVLRKKCKVTATMPQNQSSDPLRLHQN